MAREEPPNREIQHMQRELNYVRFTVVGSGSERRPWPSSRTADKPKLTTGTMPSQ